MEDKSIERLFHDSHWHMWDYFFRHPELSSKDQLPDFNKKISVLNAHCYLCECYIDRLKNSEGCNSCPFKKKFSVHCLHSTSPYYNWTRAKTNEERALYAKMVRDLVDPPATIKNEAEQTYKLGDVFTVEWVNWNKYTVLLAKTGHDNEVVAVTLDTNNILRKGVEVKDYFKITKDELVQIISSVSSKLQYKYLGNIKDLWTEKTYNREAAEQEIKVLGEKVKAFRENNIELMKKNQELERVNSILRKHNKLMSTLLDDMHDKIEDVLTEV